MPFLYRRNFFFPAQYSFLALSALLLASYPVSAQQLPTEKTLIEEKNTSAHSPGLMANEPSATTETALDSRNINAQRLLIEAATRYAENPLPLAKAYSAVGDGRSAARLYQQALSQAQATYDAYPHGHNVQQLADIHITLGNFDLADQILQDAVKEIAERYYAPQDAFDLERIATLYGKFPDENLAHQRLKAIYKIDPGTYSFRQIVEDVVSVYAQFDNHEIAQRELTFLSAEAINYIDTKLTLESTSESQLSTINRAREINSAPDLLFNIAIAQREQGDIDGARESINHAVRVETELTLAIAERADNDSRPELRRGYAERLFAIAKEQSLLGEQAAAIERIEKAEAIATEMDVVGLTELRDFVGRHISIARAYNDIGEVARASDVLGRADEAVERDRNRISNPTPKSWNLSYRYRLAIAHGEIGNVAVEQNELEQVFDELIELHFTSSEEERKELVNSVNSIVSKGIVVYSNIESPEKADDYLVIIEDWINRSVAAGGSYLHYLDLAAAARGRGDVVAADRLSQASLPLVQPEESVSRFKLKDIAESIRFIENPETLRLALEEVDRLAASILQAETDTRKQENLRNDLVGAYLGAV